MQPIATTFQDATFLYIQVERQGDFAIYAQQHKEGGKPCYEVVRIRVSPEHTWPNGTVSPERETYPNAKRWGIDGFSCFSMDEAKALLADLRSASAPHGPADTGGVFAPTTTGTTAHWEPMDRMERSADA